MLRGAMTAGHDLHDFIGQVQTDLTEEYNRIFRRAAEDPGTAGDEGEETWKKILEDWLPREFTVVTKGRILGVDGQSSGQMDVLVLSPSYPPFLRNRKQYLAPGVLAAFECKLTLKKRGIVSAVEKGARLKRMLRPELDEYPPPYFGILAHSHAWNEAQKHRLSERISTILDHAELMHAQEPVEVIDSLCVANFGAWTLMRLPLLSETSQLKTCFMGPSFHPETDEYQSTTRPVGRFLTYLLRRLASRDSNDLAAIAKYMTKANLEGFGTGQSRDWPTNTLPSTVPNIAY
jgi:hypothetical protein